VTRPRIFLNYRREDTRGYAGRLYDRLSSRFGEDRIFRDVDAIPPGIDYLEYVDRVVGQCDVMLVLIGDTWNSVKDARGRRRLDHPHDLVRLEIAAGLERNIPVIPVLMQGASMPTQEDLPGEILGLARRNALEMSDRHWNYDWDRLTRALDQLTRPTAPKRPYRKQPVDREDQATPEPIENAHPTGVDISESGTGRQKRPISRPVVVALATVLPLLLLLTAVYLVARNNESQSSGDKQASTAASPAATGTRATTTSQGMKTGRGGMTANSAYPNASEHQLLTYVPTAVRRDCDRAAKPLPGAVAGVRCFSNNLPSVQYNLFKSNDAMSRLFNSRVKWVHDHTGPCNTTAKDSHLDKAIHDEVTVGSLLCYERGGEARLEWTNKSIHVYTYSYSRSLSRHDMYHRVYRYAGPESHKKASAHNG
jgi:hypothetical protein